jgi:hypothetical protein
MNMQQLMKIKVVMLCFLQAFIMLFKAKSDEGRAEVNQLRFTQEKARRSQ